MNVTVCSAVVPVVPVPTLRPWWQRAQLDLLLAWRQWQADRREQRALRALEGLSDQTLRDIGLAERLPPQPHTLGPLDYERGRWS